MLAKIFNYLEKDIFLCWPRYELLTTPVWQTCMNNITAFVCGFKELSRTFVASK